MIHTTTQITQKDYLCLEYHSFLDSFSYLGTVLSRLGLDVLETLIDITRVLILVMTHTIQIVISLNKILHTNGAVIVQHFRSSRIKIALNE